MSDQQEGMERMQARYRGPSQLLCPAGFPVPEDTKDWTVQKGDKGDKGERGEKGASHLPYRQSWAIVYLFVIAFIIAGASLLLTSHEISQNNQKWCATIDLLDAQKPPSGSAASNPSRAYEQQLYTDFHRLRSQLGCG